MKQCGFCVSALATLLLISFSGLAAEDTQVSVGGVVLSVAGKPVIERGGGRYTPKTGMYVLFGDEVRLSKNDSISILMATGRVFEMDEEGSVVIADDLGQEEWYSQYVRGVLSENFGIHLCGLEPDMEAAASYDTGSYEVKSPSAASGVEFAQVYPYNAAINDSDTAFRWTAPEDMEQFSIEIFEESSAGRRIRSIGIREVGDETMWDADGGSFVLLSERTYSWKIRGWNGQTWEETTRVHFWVLDKKDADRIRMKLSALEGAQQADKPDITPYVIASLLLMRERLYHQALEHVANALAVNEYAPFLYTLRGRIYERMQLPHLASAAYEQAASLR